MLKIWICVYGKSSKIVIPIFVSQNRNNHSPIKFKFFIQNFHRLSVANLRLNLMKNEINFQKTIK
jgi:hypothetical protein